MRALGHRDYRLFFAGQIVSLIGTWMQSVGQAWLVLELTNSPFKLGLLGTLQFGPMLLFAFLSGAIADRVRKRRLILATQSALMLQAFALSALAWTGHVQYWHVAVLATLYGLVTTLDMPARQSFMTDLVGRNDLPGAIALNSAVFNGARVVGPAVAGLLVARYGVALAFLLNGLSFLAVLGALRRCGPRASRGPAPGPRCSKTSPRARATPRPRR
jgi:MFS family permease